MSQIKWTNPAGGDFATATNWMGGVVPGPSDDAIFSLAGHYIVTSSANETVNSLQMVKGPTLAITAGTFTATNGSGSGTDNGLIQLGDNTDFVFGGTLAGTGTLQVNGTYYGTNLLINSATATLSGGGTIALGDFGGNRFYANTAGDQLINASDTISGAGQLGNGNMAISNGAAGVINANAAGNALVLNAGTYGVSNAGLIEATGTAGLIIASSGITQTGTGTVQAINSFVYIENSAIAGGAVSSTGTGEIQVVYGDTGELNGVKIAAGTVQVSDNADLYLDNTITNDGTIFQDGTYYGNYLYINSAAVTLTGGGSLTLSDYSANRIAASVAGDKLVNLNNIISGSGQIGNNSTLAIDNRAAGVINSNGTQGLTFSTTGAVTNEGVIKDTGLGGLGFSATAVTNTGTIEAVGAGSHVDIYGGSSIIGGFLATSGGGVIDVPYGQNGTLDGSTHANPITITTGSVVQMFDNSDLELNGSIVNDGTIFQDGTYYGDYLVINSPTVTLSGGGTVLMSDNNASNRIEAAGTTGYKLVDVDNTIIGSGNIGYGTSLTIDNQLGGTINSNGTTGLTISTLSAVTNEGLIEDTGAGGLGISATTITNNSTIAAYGAGSHVDLANYADIVGGTLATSGGGVIQDTYNYAQLDGLTDGTITIATGSTVQNLDNQVLYLDGTFTNKGTLFQAGTYYGANLIVNSPTVTLTGGGTLLMSDLGNNRIYDSTAGEKLVNVNNTIVGSGQLGYAQALVIDNQALGVINSNGGAGFTISTTSAFTNEGLIEDTGAGGLGITATTITNTGTIGAFGVGSHVDLANYADIIGGTLSTSGGGVIQDTYNYATLDGATAGAVTITAGSVVQNLDNQVLVLDGTINNKGTLFQAGTYYGANLILGSATVTLTGGGTLLMSDLYNNRIYTNTAGYQLVNVNNKIVGSGQIGYGQDLLVDNQAAGVINSNGGANITLSTTGAFTNEGLIEDTGPGGIGISATDHQQHRHHRRLRCRQPHRSFQLCGAGRRHADDDRRRGDPGHLQWRVAGRQHGGRRGGGYRQQSGAGAG